MSKVGYFSSFSSFLKRTKQMTFSMIFVLLLNMLAFLNYKDARSSLQSPLSKNKLQGGFFNWSALKMTKCQPLKEFSELVLPKND